MARELHDELGQTLTGLKLGLRALRDAKSSSVDVAAARIDALTGMVDAAVVDLRRIAADLRPLMLDELGLGPAVEWLTGNFSTRHAIPVSLALAQLPRDQRRMRHRHISHSTRIADQRGQARERHGGIRDPMQ